MSLCGWEVCLLQLVMAKWAFDSQTWQNQLTLQMWMKYDQKMFQVQDALVLLDSQEALQLPILETRPLFSDRQANVIFHKAENLAKTPLGFAGYSQEGRNCLMIRIQHLFYCLLFRKSLQIKNIFSEHYASPHTQPPTPLFSSCKRPSRRLSSTLHSLLIEVTSCFPASVLQITNLHYSVLILCIFTLYLTKAIQLPQFSCFVMFICDSDNDFFATFWI